VPADEAAGETTAAARSPRRRQYAVAHLRNANRLASEIGAGDGIRTRDLSFTKALLYH
jgi:hypothetical protein